MSDQVRGEYLVSDSSPLALLVDAANAKSQETSKSGGNSASSSLNTNAYRDTSERSVVNQFAATQQIRANDAEWREALQIEALQREALEREAIERELLHRQALLMSYGGLGGFQGIGSQEAEYLQQLRLEALIQQRRQEAIAQLALAQDMGMSPQMHALLQAQQLRQAALLGQGVNPSVLAQESLMASMGIVQERKLAKDQERDEEIIRKDKYEQQQKLANLNFGGPKPEIRAEEHQKPAKILSSSPEIPSTMTKTKIVTESDQKLSKSKEERQPRDHEPRFTTIPCPARGMPSDHDSSSAYFKIADDIKHGANLVCSYYACRNAGAQYRYCGFCKTPVSKWSFAKLHKHDSPITPVSSKDKFDAQTILTRLIERGAKEVEVQGSVDEQQFLSAGEKQSGKVISGSQEEAKLIAERQSQWDRLLDTRPKCSELIIDWVQQVLATSDLDIHHNFKKNELPTINKAPTKSNTEDTMHVKGGNIAADKNPLQRMTIEDDKSRYDLVPSQNGVLQAIIEEKLTSYSKSKMSRNLEAEDRGQFDDASDGASSISSEDSVDLRANKKWKASN